MISWDMCLKIKLIFVKDVVIHEIFIQAIMHNMFNYFEKKNRRVETSR